MQGQFLTREQQPELPSHALRNPLEDQLLRLLGPIHAHPLPVLGEVVLPRLLLQELLSLGRRRHDTLGVTAVNLIPTGLKSF